MMMHSDAGGRAHGGVNYYTILHNKRQLNDFYQRIDAFDTFCRGC